MKMMSWLAPLALVLVGCGEEAGDTGGTDTTDTVTGTDTETTDPSTTGDGELAIVGTWTDSWGADHEITEALWSQTFPGYSSDLYHIADHNNGQRWLIAENDADNAFSGGLWSRFDWKWSDDQLYYCQTAFGAATADEALETPAADDSDLETGCVGFAWTELIP